MAHLTETARAATAPLSTEASKRPIPGLDLAQVTGLLRLADLAAIVAPAVIIYLVYVWPGHAAVDSRYVTAVLAVATIAVTMIQRSRGYRSDTLLADAPPIGRILSAWGIAIAIGLALAFALKVSDHYSRVWATSWFLLSGLTLALARAAIFRSVRRMAAAGRFASRTALIGAGARLQRLEARLTAEDAAATRIVMAADERAPESIDRLFERIRAGEIDRVLLALPEDAHDRAGQLIARLAETPVDIRLAPVVSAQQFDHGDFVIQAGLPIARILDRPISGWDQWWKAIEDRCLAMVFLILLAPLFLAAALAIKLDSPGPVFFKQRRYGFNNQPITVLKFRTMEADRGDEFGARQTSRNDPRVTRTGRFLRRASIDELPQLINVLRGEMSIVGPRPHALGTRAEGRAFEEVVDQYAARHRVKPGITGWAQVNGWRGEIDSIDKIQKRVEHDLHYIENWSIGFDLLIILMTMALIIRDRRAY